jgi:hypothetical protein
MGVLQYTLCDATMFNRSYIRQVQKEKILRSFAIRCSLKGIWLTLISCVSLKNEDIHEVIGYFRAFFSYG